MSPASVPGTPLTFQRLITFRRQPAPNALKASALLPLTGTISVVQALESQTATIEDPLNTLNNPVSSGPYEFTLTSPTKFSLSPSAATPTLPRSTSPSPSTS